jgi:hypothetical protein
VIEKQTLGEARVERFPKEDFGAPMNFVCRGGHTLEVGTLGRADCRTVRSPKEMKLVKVQSYIPTIGINGGVMQSKRIAGLIQTGLLLLIPSVVWAGDATPACVPPPEFKDSSPPQIAAVDQLVCHTEEVILNRSFEVVMKELEASQRRGLVPIRKSDALPGVSGTYLLTNGEWGAPGSRRLTCLTDGSTAEEQILLNDRSLTSAEFRYIVWNYTTEKARPVLYGVGDFMRTDLGNGRTLVRWTYSFQLNRQRFPGYLGAIGRFLFRVGFLDRDYAQMMRTTLRAE